MGTLPAAGSLPPSPRAVCAHGGTWCLPATSEHQDAADRTRLAGNREGNGGGPGRLFGGQGGGCAWGHDDINLERNEFGRKSGEPLGLPLGISVFNHDVSALDVAEVTQSLEEGLAHVGGACGHVGRQEAYSSDLDRLLGLGGERRGDEAASDQDRKRTRL